MAVGGGLHITRIAIGLHRDTTGSVAEAQDVAITVPLPVVSFALTYAVTPKFHWSIKGVAFALKYEDWDGISLFLTGNDICSGRSIVDAVSTTSAQIVINL